MQFLRKIVSVENNAIIIKNPEQFNNNLVEVIIIPLSPKKKKKKTDIKNILKFCGMCKSGYKNTSLNIDKILYGE